jgi:hypothetical protein
MNTNYELKYLKYKNKYISLKNKNLKYSIKNQIGGAPRTIIFGCSSLKETSTFDKYFDLINGTINKYIPISDEKKPYFIMDGIKSQIPDKPALLANMKANNYSEPITIDGNLIEFITSEFIEKGKQIDILFLAGCNDFLSSLSIASFYSRFFSRIPKNYNTPFDILKPNLYKIYTSVNGYIINIYRGINIFTDVEYFTAPLTFIFIILHIIFCKIFNKLFTKIDNGIYKKNDGITFEEYNRICDEEYRNLQAFLSEIETKSTKEEKIKFIIEEILPKSYFENLKKELNRTDTQIEELYTYIVL